MLQTVHRELLLSHCVLYKHASHIGPVDARAGHV